ncbi:hypothetical protein ACHAQA_003117 [Verticillium albo-atrum]
MLDTVFEVDEDDLLQRSKSIRSSDMCIVEQGMDLEAVQGMSRAVEPAYTRHRHAPAPASGSPIRLRRASFQNTSTASSDEISGHTLAKPPGEDVSDGQDAPSGSPTTMERNIGSSGENVRLASPSSFHTWGDNLRRSLHQMRLDEEQRLLERRESLQIEIPASPRSPIGRRLSGLQISDLPGVSESDRERDDAEGTPYAHSGPYQLVYAKSALQDLHHQIDDSKRFIYSMLKLSSQGSETARKTQRTRSSKAIKSMLRRLEKACGRVVQEQQLVENEMESRAPGEKWKSMLDTAVAMTSVLGVEGKAKGEA